MNKKWLYLDKNTYNFIAFDTFAELKQYVYNDGMCEENFCEELIPSFNKNNEFWITSIEF